MDTSLLNSVNSQGREQFESAMNALQGDISAAAARLLIDPRLRLEYSKRIKEMAEDLRSRANIGLISWEQAAQQAQETRNLIMDLVRTRSTPLGRAMAQQMKSSGKTLNELVAKKAISLFGPRTNFNTLSQAQKNQVNASIVESAGKSNPQVNLRMLKLSRIGKGLVVLSIAVSLYEIYTSDNKVAETGRQLAINGAGIAGGAAGGWWRGWCVVREHLFVFSSVDLSVVHLLHGKWDIFGGNHATAQHIIPGRTFRANRVFAGTFRGLF